MTNRMILLTLLLILPVFVQAEPSATAFSYQGELHFLAEPANGNFDFKFELYTEEMGGDVLGAPIEIENVVVNEGVFTVALDFDEAFIDGQALWLAIGVRDGSDVDAHTGLTPRQLITPTPYAVFALKTPSQVPQGAVLQFNLDSCPDGWSNYVAAQGRALVGMPSGGTLNGTQGTAMTDLQKIEHSHDYSDVITHSHAVTDLGHRHGMGAAPLDDRNFAGTGTTSQQHGLVADAGLYNNPNSDIGHPTDLSFTGVGIDSSGSATGTTTDAAGIPYLQLLTCVKD